jgi:hypothetical protein
VNQLQDFFILVNDGSSAVTGILHLYVLFAGTK